MVDKINEGKEVLKAMAQKREIIRKAKPHGQARSDSTRFKLAHESKQKAPQTNVWCQNTSGKSAVRYASSLEWIYPR